jgi:hypothetical protein
VRKIDSSAFCCDRGKHKYIIHHKNNNIIGIHMSYPNKPINMIGFSAVSKRLGFYHSGVYIYEEDPSSDRQEFNQIFWVQDDDDIAEYMIKFVLDNRITNIRDAERKANEIALLY